MLSLPYLHTAKDFHQKYNSTYGTQRHLVSWPYLPEPRDQSPTLQKRRFPVLSHFTVPFYCHRNTESFRLQKTSRAVKSGCSPSIAKPSTEPFPACATSSQLLNPSRGGYTNTVPGLDNPFSE